LAIGETTIGGRMELRNKDGIFYIEELEKIALQRCRTSREAISLIGKLAEEYGYGDHSVTEAATDHKICKLCKSVKELCKISGAKVLTFM
jgi:dipeptidase